MRRAGEAPRDQGETAFTPLLRWLWSRSEQVLAVAFVDREGECVDYCSSLDPFDAKVAGAHLLAVTSTVRGAVARLGGGEVHAIEIHGSGRELIVRRLDDDYAMVVAVCTGGTGRGLLEAIERATAALREDAGVAAPAWEPHAGPMVVELRPAVGWPHAPSAFEQNGERTEVAAVLGRWVEPGGVVGGELECFRVRTETGTELTLAHDVAQGRWLRW